MTLNGIIQIFSYFLIIILLVKPLGWYMACVYENKSCKINKIFGPIEILIYRLCGINKEQQMNWKAYLFAMLIFNFLGFLAIYIILRIQFLLPFNPQHFPSVSPEIAFNTAASFVTNTDWQVYSGETTLSYLTQMMALTVQNFISAATGMSLLIAFIRGLVRHESSDLGNFWVDTVRGTIYILMPLSLILAIVLLSQGVLQNFNSYQTIKLLQTTSYQQPILNSSEQLIKDVKGQLEVKKINLTHQIIPMGPVASQIAIKQLGTNGDGFFNTNSAHPFENPTPLTNFFEMLAILIIPASLCYTYGVMVNDKKQGWSIFIVMLILLLPLIFCDVIAEQAGNPLFNHLGINQINNPQVFSGGNMEGKETRFGIVNSALWATLTTATANGSVNAMHDSFTPLGGLIPLWLIHLGEVVFGGVGSGLYSMLMLVIITVFVAGLMVGRTPEYLGKKIEPFEMKMAAIAVLIMPLLVLVFTAFASVMKLGINAIGNPGAHGFTEILYAFTSMAYNNGSAFAGLNAALPFYAVIGGIAILFGRYWIAIPILAIAGSLARKKIITRSAGTLPTHTPLFIFLLLSVTLILGALTFFPALSLGPVVEHLMLWENN